MNAGGPDFTKQAFINLSQNKAISIDKFTWDLGFYNGSEHHVIINSSAQAMARPLDKTDLLSVTAEDTLGFASEMQIGFTAQPIAAAWIDEPNGDLSKTAIAQISATENENVVYIIKRNGANRNWKKVKITRNGSGYIVTYAAIDSDIISSVDISKSDAHNFNFFDLDNGLQDFEPEKDRWDFMYGTHTEKFPFGPSVIPYSFNDYIVINRYQTKVAQVMIAGDIKYESFDLSQAENLEFKTAINAIGSTWRQGGGPGQAPSLFNDRFYVIQDSADNFYKIRFTRLSSESGERGYPEFEYMLLK